MIVNKNFRIPSVWEVIAKYIPNLSKRIGCVVFGHKLWTINNDPFSTGLFQAHERCLRCNKSFWDCI